MKKCQVFTPENYVDLLLNYADYNENLYGKKILENSCGDGNILSKIVKRYISDCRRQGFSENKISAGLSNDIYGIEIIKSTWKKCINRLNLILEEEGLPSVNWKILNTNYFSWIPEIKFSYIIGNPPYITYSEIKKTEIKKLKNSFTSCSKGKFDYCYAFIEKSISELEDNGKMSYLIPSSIFKTVFGKNLRTVILPHTKEIIDYSLHKVFSDALVKSSILNIQKNSNYSSILYKFDDECVNIDKTFFSDKWVFLQKETSGNRRFGDYFQVSHAVATLYNKAFLLTNYIENDKFIHVGNYKIEREIVRSAVSAKSKRYKNNTLIIFPYYFSKGLQRYDEAIFAKRFPYTTEYLKSFSTELEKRKSDIKSKWFEYGRSQALSSLNQNKLLLSVVISDKVLVYEASAEDIPYAGMFITPKRELSLQEAKKILETPAFLDYAKSIGVHMSGNSVRIMSKDIMEYRF